MVVCGQKLLLVLAVVKAERGSHAVPVSLIICRSDIVLRKKDAHLRK